MIEVPKIFGSRVFGEAAMKERLPEDVYNALNNAIKHGERLNISLANDIAAAMRDWAISQGATHFTHWFQPMTGITAEKHDSFISPDGEGGVIMDFSGKGLVRGEPDASSFPSGGLRATFEARGYTAWDPTSPAFVKDGALCIPTVFCSYTGEVLDKKTPLLRSLELIDKAATRVLKLFGHDNVKNVVANAGAEQEYFLIDRNVYLKRPDLMLTGRTLFGAPSPKGQEMNDHYFGSIKERVSAFMKDLNQELWKFGILAKTEHNETAPAQHELAPIYSSTNIATDHNQLTMEVMKSIANKHNLACLLHEKPFAGVNGSGKHNNWSLATDTGINLFEPGATPSDNAQFLLFISAVIKAVDEYQDLLRICVSSAGNDHRLGAHEAPPAIVSIFLGEELEAIIDAIETGSEYVGKEKTKVKIGATCLPHISKDTTDRNRTSPFAFTGNKFEFRMLGSSESIACPNYILNTIVAEVLTGFADQLEKASNFKNSLASLIKDTIKSHKRILFNGNNYSQEWVEEAGKRGLSNYSNTPDAIAHWTDKKNIALFEKFGILGEKEMRARLDIMQDKYSNTLNIEALTMLEMVKKDVFPAVIRYEHMLAKVAVDKKTIGMKIDNIPEKALLDKISDLSAAMFVKIETLEKEQAAAAAIEDSSKKAKAYCAKVFTSMQDLRATVDELEPLVGRRYWKLPTYTDLLYSVN